MSVYIYLYCDRLIYVTPHTPLYKPITGLPWLKWYLVHGTPEVPFDVMIQKGNYSFSLQSGFAIITEPLPSAWAERENIVRKIRILERMNSLASTQKMRYTNNSAGQPLTDILMFEEIREYQKTSSLENCPILSSLLETTESELLPEALVMKMSLALQSFSRVVAYLNRLEFKVRQFLTDNKFDEANQLLDDEFEKIGM